MVTARFSQVVSHVRALAAGDLGDAALVARFATGDESAFAEIVRRHGKLVYGVCRRALGAGPDADDAFQAAFVVLARRAGAIRTPGALASWLYGVAYRVATELRRQRNRRWERETAAATRAEAPAVYGDPAVGAAWREVAAILDEEVQRLPAVDREAFVACLMDGMSHAEAARHLGWPLGTLKTRLERGRQALRQRLERRGIALSALALGVVLAEQTAGAVPPDLVGATLDVVLHSAASARVAGLADAVGQSAAIGTAKLVALGLLTVCLVGLGTALAMVGGDGPPPPTVAKLPAEPPAGDALDDARPGVPNLPAGALARFGGMPFCNGARIHASELSPDGALLATASTRSVTVWDAATGQVRHRFFFDVPVGIRFFDAVAFSPDSKRLAYRPTRAQVLVWDLATGKELRRFTVDPALTSFAFLRFTADGKSIIVQEDKGMAWLNLATGAIDRRLPGVRIKQLAPDGRTFATVDETRREVRICDIRTGAIVRRLSIGARADDMEQGVLFLPDGKTLAVVHHHVEPAKDDPAKKVQKREVQLWDWAAGKRQAMTWALPDETDGRQTYRLVASRDGTVLYFPEDHKYIRRFALTTGRELPPMAVNGAWTMAAFPHPDGKTLFSIGLDQVHRWDLAAGAETSRDADYVEWQEAAIAPDGRWLALRARSGRLDLIDVATRQTRRLAMLKSNGPMLAFTPDSKTLLVNRYDDVACLRVPELTEARTLRAGKGSIDGETRLSPDGRYLAVRSATGHLRIFDPATGKTIRALDEVLGVRFTPDSRAMLVWWRNRPDLTLYDIATHTIRFAVKLPADQGPMRRRDWRYPTAVEFSPDGRVLAVTTTGGQICLLDASTGLERARFVAVPTDAQRGGSNFEHHASTLTFSGDGQWLAVGGSDGFVRIWETATRCLLHRLHGHEGATTAMAFTADGRRLLSFGDGEALLWDLRPGRKSANPFGDLGAAEGAKAYRALWTLADDPAAPALLRGKIAPAHVDARPERVARLIADLDAEVFDVRDAAQRGLAELQAAARPALQGALTKQPVLETRRRMQKLLEAIDAEPAGHDLRNLRAVRALELHGSAAAKQVLREWAAGTPGLRLTAAAQAALGRLGR